MALVISFVAVAAWCAWLGWKRRIALGLVSCVLLPAAVTVGVAFKGDADGLLSGSDVGKLVFKWFLVVAVSGLGYGLLCRAIAKRFVRKEGP